MCHKSSTLHTDIDTQRHTFKKTHPAGLCTEVCVACFIKALFWFISLKTVPMTVHPRDEGKHYDTELQHIGQVHAHNESQLPHIWLESQRYYNALLYTLFFFTWELKKKRRPQRKWCCPHLSNAFIVRFAFTKSQLCLFHFTPRECPFKLTV